MRQNLIDTLTKEARIKTPEQIAAIRKAARNRKLYRSFGRPLGAFIGTKALPVAALLLTGKFIDDMIDSLKERSVKAQSPAYYAKMLEAHPELKKEDPKLVARYWASLYHFAPYMAQDALAAGSFIRQSLARGLPAEFGGPAPDTYLTLADINKKIGEQFKGESFFSEAIKGSFDTLTGKTVS